MSDLLRIIYSNTCQMQLSALIDNGVGQLEAKRGLSHIVGSVSTPLRMQGNGEKEPSTLLLSALAPDAAAVCFDNGFAERQPKACGIA